MSIARALAVLGAGASGYSAGQDQARKQKRDDDNEAWTKKQRDRQEQQWQRDDEKYQREQADLEAQRRAAAPVEMQTNAPGDDVGPTAYRAGNTGGWTGDQAATQGQVAEQNTPSARMGRAAAVTADPVRAAQMQATAGQAELGQIQLAKARDEQDYIKWREKAAKAVIGTQGGLATPESIAKWMSESKADGKDGASQWKAKKDGDTITVYPVGPDGTALNAGIPIKDTAEDRMQFLATLDTRTPLSEKLKDIRATNKEAREDRKAEARAATEATRAEAAMVAARAQETRAEAQARRMEAVIGRMGGGGGAGQNIEDRLPPAVKLQYATAAAELKQIGDALAKSMAEGQYNPESIGTKELMLRQRELTTLTQRMLAPYVPGAKPEGEDPLGLFKGKPAPAAAPSIKAAIQPNASKAPVQPNYKTVADGRIVDLNTGRTLSPEQAAILEKMQRGEPTNPRERAILEGM